jgi:hypothetical protein
LIGNVTRPVPAVFEMVLFEVGDIHIPPTSRALCDGVQIGLIGADLAVILILKLARSLFAKYGS